MAARDAPGRAAGWGQLPPGQQEGAELPPSSFGGIGVPWPPEGKLGLSQGLGEGCAALGGWVLLRERAGRRSGVGQSGGSGVALSDSGL